MTPFPLIQRRLVFFALVAVAASCSRERGSSTLAQTTLAQVDKLAGLNSDSAKKKNKIYARFEQGEIQGSELSDLVSAISNRTGVHFEESNFKKTDDLLLMTSHYQRYAQVIANSEVEGASIRVWLSLKTKEPILVEAFLLPAVTPSVKSSSSLLRAPFYKFLDFKTPNTDFTEVLKIVNEEVKNSFKLTNIISIKTSNIYSTSDSVQGFVRRIEVKEKYRTLIYDFANRSATLLNKTTHDLPSKDPQNQTYSLPANVYPLWEIVSSPNPPDQVATPASVMLPNLLTKVPEINYATYIGSKKISFLESLHKYGPLTLKDYLKGYWNQDLLNFLFPDSWENHGRLLSNEMNQAKRVRLFGKNAIVLIHKNAPQIFSENPPKLDLSPQFNSSYNPIKTQDDKEDYQITFSPLYWGIPIVKEDDLLRRLPAAEGQKPRPENTAELLRSGFDEAQVYYATDSFLSTFQNLGFKDPELSTKPFVAILFDPDIEGKDNAFYSDNTINFMTYSANGMNYARDNSTIWHELGHGLQDRLMGPHVDSSEGYGLWEGMADFLAQIIIADKIGSKDFEFRNTLRILNDTYFYLTNESHDEGEAYGGAMYVMLDAMMDKFGDREGILRMTDLTLETMRLTRDHPRLTAEVWFEQMKYVDTLNREIPTLNRQAGQLLEIINQSLAKRNYSPSQTPAKFEIKYKDSILTDRGEGSRASPILVDANGPKIQTYELNLSLIDGDSTKFKFPVTIRVAFRGGALQGAMKWVGEDVGPIDVMLDSPESKVTLPIQVDTSTCDFINRNDGGCQDYAYLQVFNAGDLDAGQPIGKKRFYLRSK
ncbi:MAG: hypothetical protein WCI18_11315 [Pseudomonadota bacterium]